VLTELGKHIRASSERTWGRGGVIHLIGKSRLLAEAQRRLRQFGRVHSPILLTGESGVGKELFAKALYLLSDRCGKPFVSVNCAQYQNDELLVSELFGHKKGSFTGAVGDHRGFFEAADGGLLFLDEVGELSHRAQAMLLRALSEGEVRPLGSTQPRTVDVRIVAATNRSLRQMVSAGSFREDLYYRLRYLHLQIPPIRDRDDDWELLVRFYLGRTAKRYGEEKRLAHEAWRALENHTWPGNVREIRSIVDVAYCLSEEVEIGPESFVDLLAKELCPAHTAASIEEPAAEAALQTFRQITSDGASFWDAVREPFLDRELNRRETRDVVRLGLNQVGWNYTRVVKLFNMDAADYLRFMDFLRHHRLKPEPESRGEAWAA